MPTGHFISIEGPNRAGKSTFIQALIDRLRAEGRQTLLFREPGGSAFGELMRPTLKGWELRDFTRALAFNSVRAQNVAEIVEPALAAGQVVIADRYFDSTSVYQVMMGRLGRAQRAAIDLVHAAMTQPDLTIFLLPSLGLVKARAEASVREAELDVFEKNPDSEVAAYAAVASRAKAAGRPVIEIEYDEATQDQLMELFDEDPTALRFFDEMRFTGEERLAS